MYTIIMHTCCFCTCSYL